MRVNIPIMMSVVLLAGCQPEEPPTGHAAALGVVPDPGPIGVTELRENRAVYDQDNLNEVPIIRLTVWDLEGLDRVHSNNPPDAEVRVRFQAPGFAEGTEGPNGRLSLRGTSSRLAILKSYKIKLDDEAGRWKDQKTIHLLKNPWDLTRVRNYLAFEFFKLVRHMTSMRHQYVHVYLNGRDMGLYEWFEAASKRFLESHGLDRDGQLYKAGSFVYTPYSETLFDCNVPRQRCLEIAENHDPAKVKRLLDAVNDMSQDINDIIDTYFDRGNYETWLATQILFANYDSASQNYFLYSPKGVERWYYLPWDYNGAFGFHQQPDWRIHPPDRAFNAPGYWWKVLLHQRFLMDPQNVESLRRRIIHVRENMVKDSRTRAILDRVHDTVRTFVSREPDLLSLPVSDWGFSPEQKLAEWEGEWTRIRTEVISQARHGFDRTVEWPMPVWLGSPSRRSNGEILFRWDPSFDLQGDDVTYDFRLSRTPSFQPADIIVERRGLEENQLRLPAMAAGTYYYTLIIRDSYDPQRNWVTPFSGYFDIARNRRFPGVKQFTLP